MILYPVSTRTQPWGESIPCRYNTSCLEFSARTFKNKLLCISFRTPSEIALVVFININTACWRLSILALYSVCQRISNLRLPDRQAVLYQKYKTCMLACAVEVSGNVFFNPIPSHFSGSFPLPFPIPGLA